LEVERFAFEVRSAAATGAKINVDSFLPPPRDFANLALS
jgi:hypothetical protein